MKLIRVPLLDKHNFNVVIGFVEINEGYIAKLKDHCLTAGYIAENDSNDVKELVSFGLIEYVVNVGLPQHGG